MEMRRRVDGRCAVEWMPVLSEAKGRVVGGGEVRVGWGRSLTESRRPMWRRVGVIIVAEFLVDKQNRRG